VRGEETLYEVAIKVGDSEMELLMTADGKVVDPTDEEQDAEEEDDDE
jgi:hypothetical protein